MREASGSQNVGRMARTARQKTEAPDGFAKERRSTNRGRPEVRTPQSASQPMQLAGEQSEGRTENRSSSNVIRLATFAIVSISRAITGDSLPSSQLPIATSFERGWAQNGAHSSCPQWSAATAGWLFLFLYCPRTTTSIHARPTASSCMVIYRFLTCFGRMHLGTVRNAGIHSCSALQSRLDGEFPVNQLHAFSHAGETESLLVERCFQVKADARIMYRQFDLV